jgi:hypothetical protein
MLRCSPCSMRLSQRGRTRPAPPVFESAGHLEGERLQGQSAKLLGVGDATGSEFDELITLAVLLEIY